MSLIKWIIMCVVLVSGIEYSTSVASAQVRAKVETTMGTFEIEFIEDSAPQTIASFVALAKTGYFEGSRFHRVLPGILIQGGGSKNKPASGPGYCIGDEYNRKYRHEKGTVSLASKFPGGGGSQFMISQKTAPHLDGRNNIFGKISSGWEVIESITKVDLKGVTPSIPVLIKRVSIEGSPVVKSFKKVVELDIKAFPNVAGRQVDRLATAIGSSLGLGPIIKSTIDGVRARCGQTQANYTLEFKNAPKSKLLIYGTHSESGFEIEKHQFQAGK